MRVVVNRVPIRRRRQVHELRIIGVAREHPSRNSCRSLTRRFCGVPNRQVRRQTQPQRVGELLPVGHVATVHEVTARKANSPWREIDIRIRLRQVGQQGVVDGLLRVVHWRQHRVALERLRIRQVAHRVGHDAEGVGFQDAAHRRPVVRRIRRIALDDHALDVSEGATVEAPATARAGTDDVLVLVPVLDLRVVLHPEPTAPDVQGVHAVDAANHVLDHVAQKRWRRDVHRSIRVLIDRRQIAARGDPNQRGEDAQDFVSHGLLS